VVIERERPATARIRPKTDAPHLTYSQAVIRAVDRVGPVVNVMVEGKAPQDRGRPELWGSGSGVIIAPTATS
jgi:hypothetical protein